MFGLSIRAELHKFDSSYRHVIASLKSDFHSDRDDGRTTTTAGNTMSL